MRNTPPFIPVKLFNQEVLTEVIKIYAHVVVIKNPCDTDCDLQHEMMKILSSLVSKRAYSFRFGSSLTQDSELVLSPMIRDRCLYVGFDFASHAPDELEQLAYEMREKFHEQTLKHLCNLPVHA